MVPGHFDFTKWYFIEPPLVYFLDVLISVFICCGSTSLTCITLTHTHTVMLVSIAGILLDTVNHSMLYDFNVATFFVPKSNAISHFPMPY